MKISHSVSGAIRQFSYWIANGTESPSLMEAVYAIFVNNLKMDENGEVLNGKESRLVWYGVFSSLRTCCKREGSIYILIPWILCRNP